MNDQRKTKKQLIEELTRLRERVSDFDRIQNERQQAENALRASELKYRRLHESMTDAFVLVEMSGRILETNRAYHEMLGYSEEELCRLTYVDLTPEKWHAYEAGIVEEQILKRDFSAVYEKEYRKKDGTVFPVELRTFLIRDKLGQPEGMWAIVRDITERKRMEEELQKNRKFLNSILDNAPMPVYVISPDDRYMLVNKAWGEYCGKDRKEIIGLSVDEVFSAETAQRFLTENEEVTLHGLPLFLEEQLLTPLGSRHFHTVKFPVLEDRGKIEAIGTECDGKTPAAGPGRLWSRCSPELV